MFWAYTLFGLITLGHAQTPPAAPTPASPAANTPAKPAAKVATPKPTRPAWKELTPAQQSVLAPLVNDWETLETPRKHKWLEVAARFPTMKADEQQRSQERMREWVRLTPEQRRVARDSYARVQSLPPEKRAELLERYQQLPDDKKHQLTVEGKTNKTLTPAKPASKLPPPQPVPSKAQIRQGAAAPVPGRPATAATPKALASQPDAAPSPAAPPAAPASPANQASENSPDKT